MRKIVAFEGKKTDRWTMLKNGALTPFEGVIPVFVSFAHEERVIGAATAFQRNEETGEVSFELTLNTDEYDIQNAKSSFYVDEAKAFKIDGVTTIEYAVIRSVCFLNPPRAKD